MVHAGNLWILAFKDERKTPQVKKLRLAFANSPAGPWKDVTEPFTGDWVEGPTVAQIGPAWWIYFDHYTAPPPLRRHGREAIARDTQLNTLNNQSNVR